MIKKALLISVVSLGFLFAEPLNSANRVQTMQNLEIAMSIMQKGFLYNNLPLVEQGVKELKDNVHNVQDFEVTKDEAKLFNASVYSKAEVGAITKLADSILINFKNGNKVAVLESYKKTLNRCLTCHRIVRKW